MSYLHLTHGESIMYVNNNLQNSNKRQRPILIKFSVHLEVTSPILCKQKMQPENESTLIYWWQFTCSIMLACHFTCFCQYLLLCFDTMRTFMYMTQAYAYKELGDDNNIILLTPSDTVYINCIATQYTWLSMLHLYYSINSYSILWDKQMLCNVTISV